MKNRTFTLVLIIEAVLCAIAALAFSYDNVGYLTVMQFPFAQLGILLRGLSLSGTIGNVAAFIIYIVICAMPLIFAAIYMKKKTLKAEDGLLVLLSGFAFYMMYMMINPGMLSKTPSFINKDLGMAILGGAFYSVLIGYLVLKMLRRADTSSTEKVLKVLRLLLAAAAVVIVFGISYMGIGDVRIKLDAIQSGNTDPSVSLGFTNFFVVLRYVMTQLPTILEVVIFVMAMRLCDFLHVDKYGDDAIRNAENLAKFCKITVVVIMLSCMVVNLLQVVFASSLVAVEFNTVVPLDSIIVALTALLLTRFFVASRELSQDNKMFI